MRTVALAGHAPVAINLNQPGTYLNWWNVFITISVANLVLIAVMVAIFGAALLLPFPGRHRQYSPAQEATEPEPPAAYEAAEGDERMWTARVRRQALTSLPPNKLLPDRQPAYVASWVYVFGVAITGRARRGDRERLCHRARRPRLVAHQPGRALLQQLAPVERGAVHGAAGHPPVGQVLDGGLARPPGADLDHRRGRLPGVGRGVLHRLPVPAELRLPVDRHQRQGRVQRGRRRARSST